MPDGDGWIVMGASKDKFWTLADLLGSRRVARSAFTHFDSGCSIAPSCRS